MIFEFQIPRLLLIHPVFTNFIGAYKKCTHKIYRREEKNKQNSIASGSNSKKSKNKKKINIEMRITQRRRWVLVIYKMKCLVQCKMRHWYERLVPTIFTKNFCNVLSGLVLNREKTYVLKSFFYWYETKVIFLLMEFCLFVWSKYIGQIDADTQWPTIVKINGKLKNKIRIILEYFMVIIKAPSK